MNALTNQLAASQPSTSLQPDQPPTRPTCQPASHLLTFSCLQYDIIHFFLQPLIGVQLGGLLWQLSLHLHHSLLHGRLQGVVLLGQHRQNKNNRWISSTTATIMSPPQQQSCLLFNNNHVSSTSVRTVKSPSQQQSLPQQQQSLLFNNNS